jgi:hypothetical protein
MDNNFSLDLFPWMVIESPRKSFHKQSKVSMRVASKEQGGAWYDGPQIIFPERWAHIKAFYVLESVELGFYIAQSLHDSFHY